MDGFIEEFSKLRLTPGKTRHDGSRWHSEGFGDFGVGETFQIKQGERRPENLIDFGECFNHARAIEFAPGFHFLGGHIRLIRRQILDGSPALIAIASAQKFAVQRGKKPRLRLLRLPQSVALCRPDVESLLRKIASGGLTFREAVGKTIKGSMMRIDELLEKIGSHRFWMN